MRTRFIIRGAAGRKGVFMIPIQWKQNDKKTMHVNEAENGVVYLTWPAIEKIEGIRHAFSTRIGGVSKDESQLFARRRSGECAGELQKIL